MALGDLYATAGELKTRLDITTSGYDTQLTQALTVASRGAEKWCQRQFNDAGAASARVYYPTNCGMVAVEDFSTTTGLVIATDSGADGTYETTLASSQYELSPLNGIVNGMPGWPYWRIHTVNATLPTGTGRASVQVTARWGWAAVPADVKEAALIVAEETFKLKDAPFGVAGFGEYGVVRIRANPKAAEMLADYRRRPVLVG